MSLFGGCKVWNWLGSERSSMFSDIIRVLDKCGLYSCLLINDILQRMSKTGSLQKHMDASAHTATRTLRTQSERSVRPSSTRSCKGWRPISQTCNCQRVLAWLLLQILLWLLLHILL